MGVEDVIEAWIARGGEGAYPSLQVTRRGTGSLSSGQWTRGGKTYFRIAASIRPGDGAELQDEGGGRYTVERRKLYTKTAEVWPTVGAAAGVGGAAHEADVVTLYATAAELDLSAITANIDALVESVVLGGDGNAVTIQTIGDAMAPDVGVYDESAWPAIVFTYKPDTTTLGNFGDAVAASSFLKLISIGDPTALFDGATAPTGDELAATNLAGGTGEKWRVVTCSRYRRFWKAIIERLEQP